MIYYSTFGKLDTSRLVSVYIGTNGDKAYNYNDTNIQKTQITLGSQPIKLVCNGSESVFQPLKPLSATITIITQTNYSDMYSSEAQGVDVLIKDGNNVLFYGFVTPCAYNQGWEGVDELELECISPISSLEYLNYKDTVEEAVISSWYDIIVTCLRKTNWYKHFYFPNNYSTTEGRYETDILKKLYQNELNFFDDNNEKTPWTCKNVLEEICKFFGVSLLEYKGEIYFVDYNALNYGNTYYTRFDIDGAEPYTVDLAQTITIVANSYRENGQNISYDEVYKKVTVKDNLYEMESLFPSVLREEDLVELHPNIPYLTFTWTDSEDVQHTQLLRLFYNKNYTHRFYRVNREISEYNAQGFIDHSYTEFTLSGESSFARDILYYNTDDENLYKSIFINVIQNYVGAIIVKKMEFETRQPPKKYNWDLQLLFSYGVYNYESTLEQGVNSGMLIHFYDTLKELPVMTLKTAFTNNMVYSTSSDTDLYLAINGDSVFYSNAIYSKGNSKKMTLYEINNQIRTPVIQTTNYASIIDGRLTQNVGTVQRVPAFQGGFGVYIHFDNGDIPINPVLAIDNDTNLIDNKLDVFENAAYWMNLNETDGYLFQIVSTYTGGIQLDILPPIPVYQGSDIPASICFVSDFNVNFVSGSASLVNLEGQTNKNDVIFTSVEDNNKALEFDDIELKVNTQQIDKQFSYSSVIRKVNDTPYFLGNFYDQTIYYQWYDDSDYDSNNNIQEMNLVRKYYNHYSSPKIIYEAVLDESVTPFAKITETNFNKSMMVDSYELDVQSGRTTFKLIEL